jgi:hypothetical protein
VAIAGVDDAKLYGQEKLYNMITDRETTVIDGRQQDGKRNETGRGRRSTGGQTFVFINNSLPKPRLLLAAAARTHARTPTTGSKRRATRRGGGGGGAGGRHAQAGQGRQQQQNKRRDEKRRQTSPRQGVRPKHDAVCEREQTQRARRTREGKRSATRGRTTAPASQPEKSHGRAKSAAQLARGVGAAAVRRRRDRDAEHAPLHPASHQPTCSSSSSSSSSQGQEGQKTMATHGAREHEQQQQRRRQHETAPKQMRDGQTLVTKRDTTVPNQPVGGGCRRRGPWAAGSWCGR